MAFLTPTSSYMACGVLVKKRIIPCGLKSSKDVYEGGVLTIPKGAKFKADFYLTGRKAEYVTIHNTEEIAVNGTTMSEQYSRSTYPNENMGSCRVHYYVDGTEAWQNLLDNEQGWHCSASINKKANRTSIAIEIIGSSAAAEDNGARLAAYLLHKNGLTIDKLRSHKDWTGKNCPAYILPHWAAFVARVKGYLDKLDGYTVDETFAVGDRVRIIAPYAPSAYSNTAANGSAIGRIRYITKIYPKAAFPYRLGTVKSDTSTARTTGFAAGGAIKKV